MPGPIKTYDADQVTISIGGVPIDSGFDDGEFCRITQDNPSFVAKQGTDGEVTRSKTKQSLTTIVITLMQKATGNGILSGLLVADEKGQNGAGVFPILIRDRGGLATFAAPECWVEGPPEVVYGREAEARAWTVKAANPERFDGGT